MESEAGSETPLDEYRQDIRSWLSSARLPAVPLDLDARVEVLRAWQGELYAAGWVGIAWSREAGGQGLTPLHQLVVSEELARAGAPMPIGLIGLDVVGPSIDAFGTEEQRRKFLPPLLSGEDLWCQGFSEPGAGSDLASLRTSARLDGERFIVNGQKIWTSWAHKARWCALLARTDTELPRHKGISYIIVDMTSPGITVRPLVQMTGDSEFCEVFFDDVIVPRANLVGELNAGWTIAQDTLSHERGSFTLRRAVEYSVAVDEAISEARAYADAGGSLPDRAAEQIGRAYVAVRGLEALTRRTMQRKLSHQVPSPYDSVDKLALNETEQRVFASISDLLGPYRCILQGRAGAGLDSERWIKDQYYSRAVSIYGGTSQIQKNIIADRLLELPRE